MRQNMWTTLTNEKSADCFEKQWKCGPKSRVSRTLNGAWNALKGCLLVLNVKKWKPDTNYLNLDWSGPAKATTSCPGNQTPRRHPRLQGGIRTAIRECPHRNERQTQGHICFCNPIVLGNIAIERERFCDAPYLFQKMFDQVQKNIMSIKRYQNKPK